MKLSLLTLAVSTVVTSANSDHTMLKGVAADGPAIGLNVSSVLKQYIVSSKNDACCDEVDIRSKEKNPRRSERESKRSFVSSCFITIEAESLESAQRYVQDACGTVENGDSKVEEDKIGHASVYTDEWGLDRLNGAVLDNDYSASRGGSGVTIYVLDSGINHQHEDFEGRASFGANFITSEIDDDLNGHGTHVAAVAAGFKYGVARQANVIGVKVLGANNQGSYAGIVQGISWAVNHMLTEGTKGVLSMSITGPYSASLNQALVEAADQGFIVVVAAGNYNDDACNYSPASTMGDIVTVAAISQGDHRWTNSNYGPCVNMFAPGDSVKSAWIGSTTATATLSGTSMATPHVAGAAAQFLQLRNGNRRRALNSLFGASEQNNVIDPGVGSDNRIMRTS